MNDSNKYILNVVLNDKKYSIIYVWKKLLGTVKKYVLNDAKYVSMKLLNTAIICIKWSIKW